MVQKKESLDSRGTQQKHKTESSFFPFASTRYYGSKRKQIEWIVCKSKNLVHPWLDKDSFSGWFIPDGIDEPLSDLEISVADTFDFRRTAFIKLLEMFKGLISGNNPAIENEQFVFQGFEAPPVLVIAGYSCAGKTVLANWLVEQFGFLHFEASDYMRQAFWERHGQASQVRIGDFAVHALKEEPWIAAKPIGEEIVRLSYPAIVVTGFRSENEISVLREQLGHSRKLSVFFIDATKERRFSRALARGREPISQQLFALRDDQELTMGLENIRKAPDVQAIKNNFLTFEPYQRNFSDIAEHLITESASLTQEVAALKVGKLEELILLALLNVGDVGLTTAQISKAIEFFYSDKKSKNNISRYFNQEFHPFYRSEMRDGRYVYKLSATGRAIANILEVHRFRR